MGKIASDRVPIDLQRLVHSGITTIGIHIEVHTGNAEPSPYKAYVMQQDYQQNGSHLQAKCTAINVCCFLTALYHMTQTCQLLYVMSQQAECTVLWLDTADHSHTKVVLS